MMIRILIKDKTANGYKWLQQKNFYKYKKADCVHTVRRLSRTERMQFAPTSEFIYSLLKLFIGLIKAAFMAWKLTVAKAINMIKPPDKTNTHHCTGVW